MSGACVTVGASVERSDALHARVRRFIASSPEAREPFDALALDIADYQRAEVEPVARLFAARGVEPARVNSADALPALPVDAFKLRRVAAHPPELDVAVFRTSGTTQGGDRRGEHPFRTLDTYRAASLDWALEHLVGEAAPAHALVLAPAWERAPDSSLSFMIDAICARLGLAPTHLVRPGAGLDLDAVRDEVDRAHARGGATLVLGTSFAYVALLDALNSARIPLPPGSRAMITGGFKGRSREVPEGELRASLQAALTLGEAQIVGEYGMTELSSQLWETASGGAARAFRAPPWLRVTAVDGESLEPVGPGEIGLARFVDLANVDSAIAVQTLDRVRVTGDRVELFGRAPGAPPRGCSLAIEELLEASS